MLRALAAWNTNKGKGTIDHGVDSIEMLWHDILNQTFKYSNLKQKSASITHPLNKLTNQPPLERPRKNDEIKFLSQQILAEQKAFSSGDTVHFVPSSSYLNFLITNKTVYEAKYWEEGKSEIAKEKDEKARQIVKQYFPDRNIYQISTLETNHNGGGLHCWSMQIPK